MVLSHVMWQTVTTAQAKVFAACAQTTIFLQSTQQHLLLQLHVSQYPAMLLTVKLASSPIHASSANKDIS